MSPRLIGATFAFVVGFPLLSLAGPIMDFTTLGGGPGTTVYLGSPQTVGNITANAYFFNTSTNLWELTDLTVRNTTPDDHGLGVCSEGHDACNVGANGSPGDVNEISQLTNTEALLLEIPDDFSWSSLWVSSLDTGGTNSNETGKVYSGTSANFFGPGGTILGTAIPFSHTSAGFDEGNIFSQLVLGGLDPTNRFLLFVSGGAKGENNDYLFWGGDDLKPTQTGGDTSVPEPGSLSLLGLGLVAVARKVRQRISA